MVGMINENMRGIADMDGELADRLDQSALPRVWYTTITNIKKGWQRKAGSLRLTPYKSEDPSTGSKNWHRMVKLW